MLLLAGLTNPAPYCSPESAFPAWCHLLSPAPQFILPSTLIQWLLPTLGVSLLGHSIHLIPFA